MPVPGKQCAPKQQRSGVALILVVIVITLLTTAGLSFALLMQQSNRSAREASYRYQSQASVDSAKLVALAYAQLSADQRLQRGGHRDNAAFFAESLTIQDLSSNTLPDLNSDDSWLENAGETDTELAPIETDLMAEPIDPTQPGLAVFEVPTAESESANTTSLADPSVAIRFGLTDEATKLNLRRLLLWERQGWEIRPMLQEGCGLTASQADLLLDWVDADSEPRPEGGEIQEYARRGLPYGPANRLPNSYQELLLIPEFDARRVYGSRWILPDARNIDTAELDRELPDLSTRGSWVDQAQSTNAQQPFARSDIPLWETLALHDGHWARSPDGQSLWFANQVELNSLYQRLSEEFDESIATYLCLGRQFGFQEGHVQQAPENTQLVPISQISLDQTQATVPLRSCLQLVETHILIPGSETSRLVNSPFHQSMDNPQALETLLQLSRRLACLAPEPFQVGRLHYQHPLVARLPGLSESAADWVSQQNESRSLTESESGFSAAGSQAPDWTRELYTAFLSGTLQRSDIELLEANTCQSSDVFSGFILGHSGYFQHPILQRLTVKGSADGAQQLYCQTLYLPPAILGQLARRLMDTDNLQRIPADSVTAPSLGPTSGSRSRLIP